MGASLNGMFGLLKAIANNASTGFRDVEQPYRQTLRFKGGINSTLSLTGGIVEVDAGDAVGPAGPTGAAGATGAQGATGAVAAIGLHDTTHSPVGLWQLQGSLADTSGSGYTATVDAGTMLYAGIAPGLIGAKLDGTLRLALGGTGANALRITGAITIEMLVRLTAPVTDNLPLFSYTAGVDDSSSTFNYLYDLRVRTSRCPKWFHEFGTGSDASYELTDLALPAKRFFHLAATRDANNVVQFYVDGRAFGAPSSGLSAATGGSLSQLWLGGSGGIVPSFSTPCNVASLKIVPSALTAAQIQAEFNRTAGMFYGKIL